MMKTFCVLFILPLLVHSRIVLADIAAFIQQATESQPLYNKSSVLRFYSQQQKPFMWSEGQLEELIRAIEASDQHGLLPFDYHLQALKTLNDNSDIKDVLATDAYLTLASHLLGGKLNPISLEPTWNARGRSRNLVAHLSEALSQGEIIASLETLSPQQPRYQIMKDELAKYRRIQEQGGWPVLPEGDLLRPGTDSPRVVLLRKRLVATGDVSAIDKNSTLYDKHLVDAVKNFQKRTSLVPDGIVGPASLYQLNQSPQQRIDQIRINLERWRWLPENFGQKHIRVNIADYRLEAHEGNAISAVYDVVVGRTYRQTPVFSARMIYLMLNPWWDTPPKLAREDILPKLQADPGLFQELGYQVLDKDGTVLSGTDIDWNQFSTEDFPYRMRQKPGDKNSLGRVKFIFPNQYSVYLHDTSSPELFGQKRRDFSSGCIRVKNPIKLAEWLLGGNQDWPRSKIDSTLESKKAARVNLEQPVPVHLFYWTVVVEDLAGEIRFLDDIYQRDAKVLEMLNQRPEVKY